MKFHFLSTKERSGSPAIELGFAHSINRCGRHLSFLLFASAITEIIPAHFCLPMTSVGLPSDEVAEDYKSSLEDLVDIQRVAINNLTVIAKENIEHASAISRALENHIKHVSGRARHMSRSPHTSQSVGFLAPGHPAVDLIAEQTPPARKLPALYLLDSIVKNVGTPYTLFLSRNLYSTFMNAYSLVDPHTRQKLDEMLQTWKAPNPGSLETKPVFPHEVTRPIEEALQKARNAAFEQQRRQALRAQQEAASRTRQIPMMHPLYRQTPTPPQMNGQYVAPIQQQYPPMMPQASQPSANSQSQQAGYYAYLDYYN